MTVAARSTLGLVAGVLLTAVGAAGAETLRLVDETGVIHYTNTPCHPRYLHLAPDACAPPPAATDGAPSPDFAREIETTATRYGVDRRLVEAVIHVESGGNPRAVSPKGAQGLMQLMPARATALGVADPFDPTANLDGGVRHLRDLLARYGGNVRLALAAYNAGEEAVQVHGGVPPYAETQAYVRKVLARYTPVAPLPVPAKRSTARTRL